MKKYNYTPFHGMGLTKKHFINEYVNLVKYSMMNTEMKLEILQPAIDLLYTFVNLYNTANEEELCEYYNATVKVANTQRNIKTDTVNVSNIRSIFYNEIDNIFSSCENIINRKVEVYNEIIDNNCSKEEKEKLIEELIK